MKAFRFRGARILEWRRVQADAARQEFLRATASVREADQHLADAETERDRAGHELVAALAAPIEVGTIARYRNWIDRQRGHVDACRRLRDQRRGVAEEKAAALHGAMRDLKAMERLRERAWRRHLDLERQEEMKTIDQLATARFARRKADEEGADRGY
jgi:flagellar export protein FliJ